MMIIIALALLFLCLFWEDFWNIFRFIILGIFYLIKRIIRVTKEMKSEHDAKEKDDRIWPDYMINKRGK